MVHDTLACPVCHHMVSMALIRIRPLVIFIPRIEWIQVETEPVLLEHTQSSCVNREKNSFLSFFPVSIALSSYEQLQILLLLSVKDKQSYKNTLGFIINHSIPYFMNKETYKSSSNDCLHKVDC